MLVLSRSCQDEVTIVDQETGITAGTLKVLACSSGRIKLGFDFDPRFRVLRSEIVVNDPQPLPAEESLPVEAMVTG